MYIYTTIIEEKCEYKCIFTLFLYDSWEEKEDSRKLVSRLFKTHSVEWRFQILKDENYGKLKFGKKNCTKD